MKLTLIDQTLGKTFVSQLESPALVIGDPEHGGVIYTRQQLVQEVGVANLVAASRLTQTLKRLRIKTVKQLSDIDPASLYRVHGTGHTQVYVAMCVLDRHGVDIPGWWGWETKGDSVRRHAREKKRRGAQDQPAVKTRDIHFDQRLVGKGGVAAHG